MTQLKAASHVVHVRLPSREHEEFVVAAKRLQESRSRLLRRAVRDIIERPAHLLDHELARLVEAIYQSACVRAGIPDFRVHDLRHTCAAWLVNAGGA